MKHRTRLALLVTLVTGTAMAQDVTFSSNSFVQAWSPKTPGISQSTAFPVTEYVGVDVAKLDGKDALSLHVYGWGMADLGEQTYIGGKNTGNLTYGYLQYDFKQANAQVKAGRFTVNQGLGPAPLDGFEARTDLVHGFMVSAFAGTPVVFKNYSANDQNQVGYQQDFMYGGRLGWRAAKVGELGVSFLQDGLHSAQNLSTPQPVDYTRKQVAGDLKLVPFSFLDVTGRTVLNISQNQIIAPNTSPSRMAEHDYKATAKLNEALALTGTYVERNFFSYYAGTTLPSLFKQNEQGMFKATGASLVWTAVPGLQLVGDVRRTDRASYGTSTRAGVDARYNLTDKHVLVGAGYHRINADAAQSVNPLFPSYSLSHSEMRAWVMADRGSYSGSLDVIRLQYTDADNNPNLNGQSAETAVVASLGYKVKDNLRVSGDLSDESNALYKNQVMALLRVTYQFGLAVKGGK
jgi:hypothetical protein